MTSGLAILVFRGQLIRLIERLKGLSLNFIRLHIFIALLLIGFFLALGIHVEHVVLVEVLIVHELSGVGLGVEVASVHFLALSDYGHCYSS